MKVLMLSRDDVYNVPGGDTVQMIQTKNELEKLGVHVQISTVSQTPPDEEFDLLHVFNWEQLGPALDSQSYSLLGKPPLILSTIFWYHVGHWFDEAASNKLIWRKIQSVAGTTRSHAMYENWQQAKFRWGRRGRSIRDALLVPAQLLPNSITEINHLESVLGLKGSLRDRCTVVPNGVVRAIFDPLPEPNRDFVNEYGLEGFILEVARIQSAKNQLGLIRALADTSFPIVFIGQPSPYERDYVNSCFEEGKRRGNVYFVSPKTPEELAGIYRLAAVHVLPSWRETPGLVSLEAAASGCQIVSTSIGSTQEYFNDLIWYCNPRDPDSIRRAVLNALETPKSEELRKLVLDRFTWDVAAKNTLEAYSLALGAHNRSYS